MYNLLLTLSRRIRATLPEGESLILENARFAPLRLRAARPFCRVATFPPFDGGITPKGKA